MSAIEKKEERYPTILKIIVIGDKGVGIRTFIKKVSTIIYNQLSANPLGVEFSFKASKDDESDAFQLWHVVQKSNLKLEAMLPHYFPQSNGGIVLFDVNDRRSFQNTKAYIESILKRNKTFIPLAVLGNKIDLRKDNSDSVTDKEAEEYFVGIVEKFGIFNCQINYYPVSVLKDANVDECFTFLAEKYNYYKNKLPKVIVIGDEDSGVEKFYSTYIIEDELYKTETVVRSFKNQDTSIGIEFIVMNKSLKHFIEQRIPYYKNAQGIIILFDVTRRESFKKAGEYIQEYLQYTEGEKKILLILGNNNSKKEDKTNSLSDQEAENYCQQVQQEAKRTGLTIQYIPHSVEKGLQVEKCFKSIKNYFTL